MKTEKILFIVLALSFAFSQHVWSNTKVIDLDSLEIAKVDSIVSLIPSDSILKFEQKYETWIESTNKPEIQIHSNPEMYKTKEYFEFKEYTLGLGPNYIGLLIDFFEDHSTGVSYTLLLHIIDEDYGYLIGDTKKELESLNLDAVTWHNSFPNCYFKNILATINVADKVSSVLELDNKTLKPHVINLFPNPISDYLVIEFELEKTETVSIILYNCLGQIKDIIQNEKNYSAGRNSIKWYKNDDITSGNYILLIESGNFIISKKIVIK